MIDGGPWLGHPSHPASRGGMENDLILQQFIDGFSAPIATSTADGRLEFVNKQFLLYFARQPERRCRTGRSHRAPAAARRAGAPQRTPRLIRRRGKPPQRGPTLLRRSFRCPQFALSCRVYAVNEPMFCRQSSRTARPELAHLISEHLHRGFTPSGVRASQ